MIPPPRQGGGGTRAPALTYVVALGGVVVHVVLSVAGGFVVMCCLVSAPLLERRRLRCRSISVNLATAPSRSWALSLSSQQAQTPSACATSWAGLTTHRSSWHFHSFRTFQRIRELLRFICGQLLLGCQAAHVLNERLVDTVGDMLVDLHIVERLLVQNITDSGDVVCTCLG